MQSTAVSPEEYQASLPEERKAPMDRLRKVIKKNLPKGFKEGMSYGMIGYVVPHSIYPAGYHCNPAMPLPFLSIASQKNFIAVYHMGVYSSLELLNWFVAEYEKLGPGKPDMGKSCIRFKNMEKIPYDLIGELCSKMTVEEWIACYEKALHK